MSLPPPLRRLAAGARRRSAAIALCVALPPLAALAALAARALPFANVPVAALAMLVLARAVARRWRDRASSTLSRAGSSSRS